MAGPGGGAPRRSHTKSRKGCDTCKRRHIRCDEVFPQCRNCTKHKTRCPYNDISASDANRSATPDKPDLMWNPYIESRIDEWQKTGVFPFPKLGILCTPVAGNYKREELRLIYHIASVYNELTELGANGFTLWTRHIPTVLSIGSTTPYVMHALLAFSAMHIAFLTDCPLAGGMAYEHRGLAMNGLQEAIGAFSRETSDAILAASLVLSWQATDWSGWTKLMQGTSTVMDAMAGWRDESQFGDFIAESCTFPTAPPSPSPEPRHAGPSKEDLEAYERTLEHIQKIEAHLKSENEDTFQIQSVTSFLKGSRKIGPSTSINEQFERLRVLRDWLFWMPVSLLQNYQGSSNSLVVIANLYTVALLMERMFPKIGSAYFGSLTLTPIEEIARRLMSIVISGEKSGGPTCAQLALMAFPTSAVSEFRDRWGWVHPQRTRSFPNFEAPNFAVYEAASPYGNNTYVTHPYGNPAFNYSAEEVHILSATVAPSANPMGSLVMPSPSVAHSYLNIPADGFGGGYSPASSTFEHSDAEEYQFMGFSSMPQGQSPVYGDLHHDHGFGFVPPSQPLFT